MRTINYEADHNYKNLRSLVLDKIKFEYKLNEVKDIDYMTQEQLNNAKVDLRDDSAFMLKIENILKQMINNDAKAELMQFPVNIRILLPERDKLYRQQPYNVDAIHCDHWSGAPLDSLNYYLYIKKEINSPYLQLFEISSEDQEKSKNYIGEYSGSPKLNLKEIEKMIRHEGCMHIFDTKTPHRINRNVEKATISIDFRSRESKEISYQGLNQANMNIEEKMSSLGVYWLWEKDKITTTMSEKIRHEIDTLGKEGTELYKKMKIDYIKKHYGQYVESPRSIKTIE